MPDIQFDPLRQLVQLYGLKQSIDAQRQQADETNLTLGLHLLNAGGDLSGVDPSVQQRLAPIAEGLRAQREQAALESGLRYGESLAPAFAPRADAAGNVVSPANLQENIARFRQIAPQLGLSTEQANLVEQDMLTRAGALGAQTQEKVAGEQRQAALSRSDAAFRQGLDTAEAKRKEQVNREEGMIDDFATRIAATNTGLVDPRENTAVALDLQAQFGNDPVKLAEVSRRVRSRATALAAGFGEKTRLTEGANTANVRAVQQEYGLNENQARLWVSGLGAMDPVLSEPGRAVVVPVPKGASDKWEEGRYALKDTIARVGDLEETFNRAQDAARAAGNIGGPLVGSQGYQEFLRVTGQQPAIAAEYDAKRREVVSLLLKARQGSRPSDYDLRFYMALVPSLEELFAGSAQGRFKALNDSLHIAAQSSINPAIGAQVAARKGPETADDRALSQAAEDYASGKIDSQKFDAQLSAWKQKRGARFVLPGAGSQPAGAADSYLQQFGIGGP